MKKREKTLQPLDPLIDYAKYQRITHAFKIGWWEMDLSNGTFNCSVTAAHLLGLDTTTSTRDEIIQLIRDDFRPRIIDLLAQASAEEMQDCIFPVFVEGESIWLTMRYMLFEKQLLMGSLATASKSEQNQYQIQAQGTVKNFLYQLTGISGSMFSFLEKESFDQMVNNILHSFITYFNAERGYIIEIDREKQCSSCTYEVVSRPGLEEIDFLTDIPYEENDWWFQELFAYRPIALSTLNDLPPGSEGYRALLAAQNIQSLLVVPMVSSNKQVTSFAGIDLVDRQYNWTVDDIQWFSALMNIINICFELQKSKMEMEADKKHLQKLYEYMPIGYVSEKVIRNEAGVPVDFVYQDFNREMEHFVGKPLGEYIGRKGSEMGIEGDLELIREVIKTNSPVEIDLPLTKYGKHSRIISFSIREDEVISLVMDVTELHEAFKAVEKTIYSNMPVGVELYDKDGYLVYMNETGRNFLELDNVNSVIGINIFEHPSLSKEIMEQASQGKKCDISFVFDLNHTGSYYRKTFPPYTMRDMTVKFVPILDESQAVQNYLFITIDNTQTSDAYRRIKVFEDYFSVVANMAKIGYCRLNLKSGEGFGTDQWFINLGKPIHTDMSLPFEERYSNVHRDDFPIIEEFYEQVAQGLVVSIEGEVRVMKAGKVDKWLKCTFISNLNPLNNQMELSAISEDITDLKDMSMAKERAEELNRLKSEFVANMSHEIRTPLNSIIGFSDILAEMIEDEEQKAYLSIIQHNNSLLLKVVSDILEISKIESGTHSFDIRKEPVCQLIGDVVRAFSNQNESSEVKIKLDPLVADYHIHTDAERVKQVLHNLMTNSLKFTSKGTIHVGCKQIDSYSLKFYVKDSGIGIASKNLDVVFDRFVKLDPFSQGTGLGLSICKSLINGMGGTIGVESELGEGSCFWFTLPICGN